MNRYARWLLLCALILAPATAGADDGGFLDWLFRLDPKFRGVGTDFHLVCLDRKNDPMRCEEFFMIRRLFGIKDEPIPYKQIQHEVNLRFAYYHTYGDLYPADPGDSAHAIKLMAFYTYHPDDHVIVGLGAGAMPFFKGDVKSTRWSGIVTPVSVRYSPASGGNIWWKSFFLQVEASWISNIPTPDLFVHYPSASPGPRRGEWNLSFAQGFDFRRRCLSLTSAGCH
jgi:hypothetical protein